MNTIELAYQPFEQLSRVTRSGNGMAWILLALAIIAVCIMYVSQARKDESLTEVNAD